MLGKILFSHGRNTSLLTEILFRIEQLTGGLAVAEETTVIINQLLTGQQELKADVSDLKEGQKRLETDVSELKTDVAVLKTDVAELKEGQRRVELFLVNMENRIVPIINSAFEEMKLMRERMAPIENTQIEHRGKLENHELRILKLEHTK